MSGKDDEGPMIRNRGVRVDLLELGRLLRNELYRETFHQLVCWSSQNRRREGRKEGRKEERKKGRKEGRKGKDRLT